MPIIKKNVPITRRTLFKVTILLNSIMDDILSALNKTNLRQWFIENDPPQSYAFWEAPEIDMIIENLDNKYSAVEFSIRCVEAKAKLKSDTVQC